MSDNNIDSQEERTFVDDVLNRQTTNHVIDTISSSLPSSLPSLSAKVNAIHPSSTTTSKDEDVVVVVVELPKNRFELELEFVQALASPAYIHFLATSRSEMDPSQLLLQDPSLQAFLRYLRDTWTRPEYARFLVYPHSLYFLNLLIENPVVITKEWTLPAYRNFCHQQQFLAWQHRHSTCYGVGGSIVMPDGKILGSDTTTSQSIHKEGTDRDTIAKHD